MAKLSLVMLLAASLAAGYSANPPDAKTGRPGEGTCLDCHSGPAGSADSTALVGLPGNTYLADSVYDLTMTARFAPQRRWGFELTAVDESGQRAGQISVSDPTNTQWSSAGPGYLKQTSAGNYRGSIGPVSWTFRWQAPPTGRGPVTFYWSVNAANNNNSTSGDAICTGNLRVVESSSVTEERTAGGRRFWRVANPGRGRTVIQYHGDPAAPVRIYAASGRLLRTLLPSAHGGQLSVTWDGRDRLGRTVPEAGYFVRLGAGIDEVVQIQLVR